ncbi:hypothetical protein HDU96_007794 [Phlyctochytrium bullatum]|nr:hypothetical protein HDU96_007794 [Phlyctochytrium bullatum]
MSTVTLNMEAEARAPVPIKLVTAGVMKSSVRFAEQLEEGERRIEGVRTKLTLFWFKEARPSFDKSRDPHAKVKSVLTRWVPIVDLNLTMSNRRIRPLQVDQLKPRISPHIPLTTRKFPERPLIRSRLKSSASLVIVTGVHKSILVADRLMRSKADVWVEWLDCSGPSELERAYREFAAYVVGGNTDDEVWARTAPIVELVRRIASTIDSFDKPPLTAAPVTVSNSLATLNIEEPEGGGRRPSVATIGSQASLGLVSDSGWGEMEEFLYPPDSEEGKKRRGSVSSTRSVPNLRPSQGSAHKPTFVFHRAAQSTFELLALILEAHKGSRFYMLLGREEKLEAAMASVPIGVDVSVLEHPSLSPEEAANLLMSEIAVKKEDALELVEKTGTDFRNVHVAAGILKSEQFPSVALGIDTLKSTGSLLGFVMEFIRDRTTVEFPLWPVLVLCSFMGSKPFAIQKLFSVSVELLKHTVDEPVAQDEVGVSAPGEPSPGVHPAARMSTPRPAAITSVVTARVNACLKLLKTLGVVDLIGWRGKGKANPIVDARVTVPRSVRFAVLAKFQPDGIDQKTSTLPRGDVPLFRRTFFENLRYAGKRLLFASCWIGPSFLVGLLLDIGFSASEPLQGIYPLHMAAIGGNIDVASILLAADADVDAQDPESRTPIFLAVTYNNLDTVRLLLDHGANPSIPEADTLATCLHVSAASGFTPAVRVLLRGGAFRNPALAVDGSTPLHLAIRNGHVDTVVALRQCGVSVHVKDAAGFPALHLAASLGDAAIVGALLEWASPANAFDANGHQPLHIACYANAGPVIKKLLEHGANPHTRNPNTGDTAVHVAVRSGNIEALRILLQHFGSDLLSQPTDHLFEAPANAPTTSVAEAKALTIGFTPLHHAVAQNRVDIMTLLLDFNHPTSHASSSASGQLTPLHIAVGLPDEQDGPIKLLLQRGANYHALDAKKRSPVHHAAKKGRVGHLKLMLEAGASADGGPGSSNKSPVFLAAAKGWPDAVRVLVEKGGRLGVTGSMWKMSASSNKVEPAVIAEVAEALKKKK